ncbi:hypothetical protein GC098_20280 [Paenibacillus sp. LMG 31458]|uniref:Uncharacterized protein n=1 Tax=Paenibacillus phytorum TaxID=2654977 RepID=A0ABX1Y1G5_9BACL|nr:hypothetical protein [Paenibacillus phytorum]
MVKDSNFEPLDSIVRNNTGILLHYVYAEDHGWSMTLFDGDKEVSQYICNWDDEIRIEDSKFDLQPFFNRGLISESSPISEQLHPHTFDELFDNKPYYRMAQELGLIYYYWTSYHTVEYRENEYKYLIHNTRDDD